MKQSMKQSRKQTMKESIKQKQPKADWMLGEDIPDIDLFFSQVWLSCFGNEFKQPSGRAYSKILTIFRGHHLWFYYDSKDSYEVGRNIVDRFLKDPSFATKVNKEIVKEGDKLRRFAEKIPEENLHKLSNKELWKIFEEHDKLHTEFYQWCWIPVAVDMFHNNLTNTLKEYLANKSKKDEGKINEYLTILTNPTKKSLIIKEHEEFLEIASIINKNKKHQKLFKEFFKVFEEKDAAPFGLATHTPDYERMLEEKMDSIREKISPSIYKLIQNYYEKYFYVKFMWIGKDGISNFDYYLKEFVKFIGKSGDPDKLLKEKQNEFKTGIKRRDELVKKLKITGKWLTIFNAFGDFMVTKIHRRYAQIYAIYKMQPILEEIASRLGISSFLVRHMMTKEVGQALASGSVNRKELYERNKPYVYLVDGKNESIIIGEQAKKLISEVEAEEELDLKELKGQTGCVGKAKGIVKQIFRSSDMQKMNKGDILVSIATDPDILPAMKKAAAFVTEQGGVTSHAAIVARELNVPCVIGTKIATKVFEDGDLVEVDAYKGIVRKVEK